MNGVPPNPLDQTIVDGEALVAKLMTWVSSNMAMVIRSVQLQQQKQ